MFEIETRYNTRRQVSSKTPHSSRVFGRKGLSSGVLSLLVQFSAFFSPGSVHMLRHGLMVVYPELEQSSGRT